MDALIADLLSLAKHGRVVDDMEPVSLPGLVDEVRTTVGMDAGQVTVADAVVHADRSRLSQLFENLLGNSLRHAGDDVRVTVGVLDDGIDGDDGDAGSDGDHDGTSDGGGFYVADDGPGIDPDRRDRVFEAGVTTADDGTGFGLKIVSEIAEAHGWTVDLGESADGGVRFAFRGVDVDDERSGSDTAS
jgi:signal transduction histidine kinase